jgi:hypothetical protein
MKTQNAICWMLAGAMILSTASCSRREEVKQPVGRETAPAPDVPAGAGEMAVNVSPDMVVSAVLTPSQKGYLARNGFVVSPGTEKEFYTVYEKARYDYQPLFITVDSLLHSFHLVFGKVLRTAEEHRFLPLLKDVNLALLGEAERTRRTLAGSDWEEAAKRAVGYTSVIALLLDKDAVVPDQVKEAALAEVVSINQASGAGASRIFPALSFGEDYSQYKPRGHYTRNESLKRYFRAMMYWGRMTFLVSDAEQTKSALILAAALRDARINGSPALTSWQALYRATSFLVGTSDDLTVPQYLEKMDSVYGKAAPAAAMLERGVEPFRKAAAELPGPRIVTMLIGSQDDIPMATKGLRFMGQRFVWDAHVFRQLVYRNVGEERPPARRGLPKGLDVLAAMGSDRALEILKGQGDTAFSNYDQQMKELRKTLGSLTEEDWKATQYGAWLQVLKTLVQSVPGGRPAFMASSAYADRSLYAALGSFAELKHDTILYAAQSYAECGDGPGKGPPPEPRPPPNYVEPLPEVWGRLADLAESTRKGMEELHLLTPRDAGTLGEVSSLARRFQSLSVKELAGEVPSDEEQGFLRFYGGRLESIMWASADYPPGESGEGGTSPPEMAEQPQAAVVADVATDPDPSGDGSMEGTALELGVGRVFDIYAAVPVGGRLYLARGGVFSYYEFPRPVAGRLTDEEWREMLDRGKVPPLPPWTKTFLCGESINTSLMEGVRRFQDRLTALLWDDPGAEYGRRKDQKDDLSRYLASELKALAAAGQYEGRRILETSYRSFDPVDENTAVVTVREIWQGELRRETTPEEQAKEVYDGPKLAERGPYTVDAAYTLKKGNSRGGAGEKTEVWEVAKAVVRGEAPPWKEAR